MSRFAMAPQLQLRFGYYAYLTTSHVKTKIEQKKGPETPGP